MSGRSARLYNRNKAECVANGIQEIIDRLNVKYTPSWLLTELHDLRHESQCIQAEFQRILRDHGEDE